MVALALAVVGLSACTSGGEEPLVLSPAAGSATAGPASTSSTSSTTAPTTTTTVAAGDVPAPPPAGLGPGAKGPAVASLEQRLVSLHYEVGRADDTFDQNTAYAVTAFQKVNGMARSGRATDDVVARINSTTSAPSPMVPEGGATRVEIDLDRQVLFLYESGSLSKILTVSSGNGKRFCSEGYCRRAVTPTGSFAVYRKARGWETGPLGSLYNPQYFNGGIAIHGSKSVPASPASHGCVRIPMGAAEWFPSRVTMGTPVYVAGAGAVPAPRPPSVSPPEPSTPAPPASTEPTIPPITFPPPTVPAPPTTPPAVPPSP